MLRNRQHTSRAGRESGAKAAPPDALSAQTWLAIALIASIASSLPALETPRATPAVPAAAGEAAAIALETDALPLSGPQVRPLSELLLEGVFDEAALEALAKDGATSFPMLLGADLTSAPAALRSRPTSASLLRAIALPTTRPLATRPAAPLQAPASPTLALPSIPSPEPTPATPEDVRLDINRATASELAAIPGLDAHRARLIVSHRRAIGGFDSVDDLRQVYGISEKILEGISPLLKADPPPAVAQPARPAKPTPALPAPSREP